MPVSRLVYPNILLAESMPRVLSLCSKAFQRAAPTCFIEMYWFKTVFLITPYSFLQMEAAEIIVVFPCQLRRVPFYSAFFFPFPRISYLNSEPSIYTQMANDEYLSVK